MARPKKGEETIIASTTLTERERDEIDSGASALGLSRAAFMRQASLEKARRVEKATDSDRREA